MNETSKKDIIKATKDIAKQNEYTVKRIYKNKKTETLNEIEEFKKRGMELPNNSPVKFTFELPKNKHFNCTFYFGTKTYEEAMKDIIVKENI